MNNSQFSSYVRDNGWGMGRHVGAIGSIVGGRHVKLATRARSFRSPTSPCARWKGWHRVIYRDQWAIWFVGCILGVAIPALVSMEYLRPEFLAGKTFKGDEVAAKTAEALRDHTGHQIFWFMTLLCGFLVMAPNQITAADGLVRRWTELLWTGNRKLHRLEGSKARFVVFLPAGGVPRVGAAYPRVDRRQAADHRQGQRRDHELRAGLHGGAHAGGEPGADPEGSAAPGWLGRIGISACAAFFLGIAALGLPQALRDLGLR